MLFWLAQGHTVLVHDFGSRNKKRGAPRALWYGLEFLKCALGYVWYNDRETRCFVRGYNVRNDFEALIQKYVDRPTMKKLKYYRQYCVHDNDTRIKLYGVYDATDHDADQEYYQNIAHAWGSCEPGTENPLDHAENEYIQAVENEIPFDHTYGKDRMHPIEAALGMRLFLGGISHDTFLQFYSSSTIVE